MASSSGRGFGTCPHQDDDGRLFHIGRLLLDGGTCLLRQVFDRLIPPCDLPIVLAKEENNLRALLVKRILTRDMMVKLYPDKNTYGKSSDFDIPLLTLLFIHLCQLKAPPSSNNWRSMPVDSDRSLEADILRLRLYTNRIFIHAEDCSIPSNDFELVSASVCAIFYRLGGIHWKRKAETMLHDVLTESESLDLNRLKDVKETCLVVKEFCPTHKSKFDHSLEMTKDSSENAKKSDAKVYYIKGKVEKIEQICEKIDQIDQLHGEGKQSKESIKKLIDKADKMKGTWDSICKTIFLFI